MKKIIISACLVFLLLIIIGARQWRGVEECSPHYWICSTIPNTRTVTDAVHVKNEGIVTNAFAIEGAFTNGINLSNGVITNDIVMDSGNLLRNPVAGTIDINADIDATGGYLHQLDYWFQENVAANQVDVVLNMDGNALRAEVPVIFDGSIIGVAVYSNAACTVDDLRAEPSIDGVPIGLVAILDSVTNPQTNTAFQARGIDAFTAGQRIGAVVTTTAGWLPVTADITVSILVEQ
jgi:hypothetical protein